MRSRLVHFTLPFFLLATPAFADDVAEEAAKLPPITVTATKQERDVEKVDGLVSIATPDELFSRGIRYADKVDRLFPDTNIRQRSSRAYSNFTIRGQSSVDFYNPTVQLYVDGLPQDPATFGQLLPLDLERIELLYGPQGTLYGRNAVGGVMNVITRKPDNEMRMVVSGLIGDETHEGDILLSTPIVEDVLYGDISLARRDEDGIYKDFFTNSELGETRDEQARIRLRYAPSASPLDVMLSASRTVTESDEEQFVLAADRRSGVAFPIPAEYKLALNSYGLTAAYDTDIGTFSSLTGYQTRQLDRVIFGSFTPEDQKTFSQEFRLVSDPGNGSALDYVIGAYYQYLDFERRVPAALQTSQHKIASYALFGETIWHITDRLDITTGLRLDYEEAEAIGSGAVNLRNEESFTALSPKLSLGYQVTENARLYALYSSGFKPGGFTRNISPANISFAYDPQYTHNFELGLKTKALNDRLHVDTAAYYTYSDDYQLFVGVQPNQYLQNAGEVVSYGLDLKVGVYPIDGLRLEGGLGLNHATFESYDNPSAPGVNLEGNRLPYAPRVTANFNVEYEIGLPDGFGVLFPHAGVSYTGEVYFDEYNTAAQSQSGYSTFDAGVSWIYNDNLSADFYVDNLTDKHYAVYGFHQLGLGDFYQLGRGREVGLRMTVAF